MDPQDIRRVPLHATVLALFAAACGSPSAPVVPDPLLGTWTGTVIDSRAGVGAATLTLVGSPSPMSGTWAFTFSNADSNNDGSMDGVAMTSATLFCRRSGGGVFDAPGRAVLSVAIDGNSMTGSYGALNCGPIDKGTLQLSKK